MKSVCVGVLSMYQIVSLISQSINIKLNAIVIILVVLQTIRIGLNMLPY